jgi:hypothetical protein
MLLRFSERTCRSWLPLVETVAVRSPAATLAANSE